MKPKDVSEYIAEQAEGRDVVVLPRGEEELVFFLRPSTDPFGGLSPVVEYLHFTPPDVLQRCVLLSVTDIDELLWLAECLRSKRLRIDELMWALVDLRGDGRCWRLAWDRATRRPELRLSYDVEPQAGDAVLACVAARIAERA